MHDSVCDGGDGGGCADEIAACVAACDHNPQHVHDDHHAATAADHDDHHPPRGL